MRPLRALPADTSAPTYTVTTGAEPPIGSDRISPTSSEHATNDTVSPTVTLVVYRDACERISHVPLPRDAAPPVIPPRPSGRPERATTPRATAPERSALRRTKGRLCAQRARDTWKAETARLTAERDALRALLREHIERQEGLQAEIERRRRSDRAPCVSAHASDERLAGAHSARLTTGRPNL